MRGLLMSFQPLQLSWFGKHELRTLHGAEWQGGQPQLKGTALLCGFYLNELLLKLLRFLLRVRFEVADLGLQRAHLLLQAGERLLGVPTCLDRLIQQAIAQVLTPVFDPSFSGSSFGFRPGRSAHQAVRVALMIVMGVTVIVGIVHLDERVEPLLLRFLGRTMEDGPRQRRRQGHRLLANDQPQPRRLEQELQEPRCRHGGGSDWIYLLGLDYPCCTRTGDQLAQPRPCQPVETLRTLHHSHHYR